MPSLQAMRAGYRNLWNAATVTRRREAEAAADEIIENKARYLDIETETGVPWWWIACVHWRESRLDFTTHLHNGDPLSARTVHVPAGRPAAGTPPYTWEESAVDALTMKGLDGIAEWTLELALYKWEAYNGWGYLGKINTPYLWAATSLQQRGKYVADGRYDGGHWDAQLGCVAILKILVERDAAIASQIEEQSDMRDITPIEHEPATATHQLDIVGTLVAMRAAVDKLNEQIAILQSYGGGNLLAAIFNPLLQRVAENPPATKGDAPPPVMPGIISQIFAKIGGASGLTAYSGLIVMVLQLVLNSMGIVGAPVGEAASPTGELMSGGGLLAMIAGVLGKVFSGTSNNPAKP